MLKRRLSPSVWFALTISGLCIVFVGLGFWLSSETPQRESEAASEQQNPNNASNVSVNIIGSSGLRLSPRHEEKPTYQKEALQKYGKNPFWETKLSDLIIGFFTACLVIVGWFTIRRGEVHSKIIERAYLFYEFENAFTANPDGTITFRYLVRNSGKTPGRTSECYAEGVKSLPQKGMYAANEKLMVNISIAPTTVSHIGGINSKSPAFIVGYVKYTDIFDDPHVTGFGLEYNK